MKWLVAVILTVLACSASAQSARVTSGEHDGFTRLVVDFGRVVDWQFGRDDDGYRLRVPGVGTSYDLARAFALIGKSRLAALEALAPNGDLKIGMACSCHAIPFEFRPGIIVIDLKDGPPPKGSSFETELEMVADNREPVALAEAQTAAPFDWTRLALEQMGRETPQASGLPAVSEPASRLALQPPDPALQPLRDNLVQQLAVGASQGVIEFERDLPRQALSESQFPSAQIRMSNAASAVSAPADGVDGDLGAEGVVCLDDQSLDIASWGDETAPAMSQVGALRASLSGEFDEADPAVLTQSVRLLLYFGFGAEARQEISAFDLATAEAPILRALGYLMDGEPDRDKVFTGQAACGGSAALWAVLYDETLRKGDPIDEGAIRLAFSALPMHLRKLLGPRLADRFLAFGNTGAARAVGDSIGRAQENSDSKGILMEAELELDLGAAKEAEALANAVLADPGQDHQLALISLTASRVAQEMPIGQEVVLALAAYINESRGGPLEYRLKEALMLAQASSGDFASAFKALAEFPDKTDVVWGLLAKLATDEVFLNQAVLPPEAALPKVTTQTAQSIAQRLVAAGLGKAAEQWLNGFDSIDPQLMAEVALQNRDARAALTALAGNDTDEATALRLSALDLLGGFALQADIHRARGDIAGETSALAKAQDWEALSARDEGPWQALSAGLLRDPASIDPLQADELARSRALIDTATETRARVETLLAEAGLQVEAGQ